MTLKIKVNETEGIVLNWLVCVAEGNKPVINPQRFRSIIYGRFDSELGYAIKNYSTGWEQGGPIIEREKISTGYFPDGWQAQNWQGAHNTQSGPTPLIAAMRCYVTSKLGDEVEVPAELA